MPEQRDQTWSYRSEGERIVLRVEDTKIVFNIKTAQRHLTIDRLVDLMRLGDELLYDLLLLDRALVYPDEFRKLEEANAVLPVFSTGRGMCIALPEVMVSAAKERYPAILAALSSEAILATRRRNGMVIHPKSNSVADAFRIANLITEQLHGVSAAPNFLRMMP